MMATTVGETPSIQSPAEEVDPVAGDPLEATADDRLAPSDPPRPAWFTGNLLLIAAWFGMAGGVVEGLWWTVRQALGGEMVFLHPGYLWMAPLALTSLTLLIGLGLAAAAWRSRTQAALTFAVTILAIFPWLNLIELLVPGLQFWSWILLACGLATVTGRLFESRSLSALKWIRRSTPVLAGLLTAIAITQAVWRGRIEDRAIAATPPTATDAPNVLLIVLDTVRADMLGVDEDGSPISPHVAEFARQGVVFQQATSTAPWTLPSQAGMFSGRLPHELSGDWLSKLTGSHRMLAEELSSRGWTSGGFVGNTRYCSAETGLARGFAHYEDYRFSLASVTMATALGRKWMYSDLPVRFGFPDWPDRKRAEQINHRFWKWLEQRPRRPYFAFLNYWDAHDPYFLKSGPAASMDLHSLMLLRNWWWANKEPLTAAEKAMLKRAYVDCVREQDQKIGELFDELKRRGELENTIVIITADHGEHLGDHDLFLHGNSLYQPLIHVPLVVVWPEKIPAGRRIDAPVSLSGLPNTVLELLDVQQSDFPGRSGRGIGPNRLRPPCRQSPCSRRSPRKPSVRPARALAGSRRTHALRAYGRLQIDPERQGRRAVVRPGGRSWGDSGSRGRPALRGDAREAPPHVVVELRRSAATGRHGGLRPRRSQPRVGAAKRCNRPGFKERPAWSCWTWAARR